MSKFAHSDPVPEADQVPIRHAATVMILADRPDLQVLMVQRTRRAVFGPNAWVFPGGRVDAEDDVDLTGVAFGMTDEQASAALVVERGGLAWWLAAFRETVEESGLLLGTSADASEEAITATRHAVHQDAGALIPALQQNGLELDLGVLHDVGQFITPVGPPRRYDTRFFAAIAPADQEASHDKEEVVQHRWISPGAAIDLFRRDEFPMMSVTHRMLACLARYNSADEVLAAARERRDPMFVRVNDPDGEYHVLLPGEPGYETADLEIEHGWVRI